MHQLQLNHVLHWLSEGLDQQAVCQSVDQQNLRQEKKNLKSFKMFFLHTNKANENISRELIGDGCSRISGFVMNTMKMDSASAVADGVVPRPNRTMHQGFKLKKKLSTFSDICLLYDFLFVGEYSDLLPSPPTLCFHPYLSVCEQDISKKLWMDSDET